MSKPGAKTDALHEAEQRELQTQGGQPVESFPAVVIGNTVEQIETRNRILKLRRQGFSSPDIAAVLSEGKDEGPKVQMTDLAVRRALARYVEQLADEDGENADLLRQIDNERLEAMFRRLEVDATLQGEGNAGIRRRAILAQIRILERHAKLNGLDAPTKHDVTGDIDHHLLADPKHVGAVDASFARRHGGRALALPGGDGGE